MSNPCPCVFLRHASNYVASTILVLTKFNPLDIDP